MIKQRLGVAGIPHAFLVDPQGTIVWEGHPAGLDEGEIRKALKGALPKPLFEFPSSASGVRRALSKGEFAAALSAADGLSEEDGGPDLHKAIQGMIDGRVASMKQSHADGDLLTAYDAAETLLKGLGGLPEEAAAKEVYERIKADGSAKDVMKAQKKIRDILDQRLGKRREFEKAVSDLEKIAEGLKGTYAAEEAEAAVRTITKRHNESR